MQDSEKRYGIEQSLHEQTEIRQEKLDEKSHSLREKYSQSMRDLDVELFIIHEHTTGLESTLEPVILLSWTAANSCRRDHNKHLQGR